MTISRNLSILADGVNSSGILSGISTTVNTISTSKVLPVNSHSIQYDTLKISVGGLLTVPVTSRFKITNF